MEDNQDFKNQIDGYKMIKPKTTNRLGYSRIIALVRSDVQVRIIPELKEEDLSTIWLKQEEQEEGLVVAGIYREHTLLGQPLSNDLNEQITRWKRTMRQWDKNGDRESLIIGDMNIDFLKWDNPDPSHTQLVEDTREITENLNYEQIVTGPTSSGRGRHSH